MEFRCGEYRIVKQLGQGSFGKVYLGLNSQDDEVALKVENEDLVVSQLEYEYQMLKYLYEQAFDKHKVVKVLDYFQTGHQKVMVMQPLGPSLQQLLEHQPHPFSIHTVYMIAVEMLRKLEYLHNNLFIHRDIKPDNILIGREKNS